MLALGANGRGRAGLLSALRPQDVFATSLYTGANATQRTVTGINMLDAGGLVWHKSSSAGDHILFDTLVGATRYRSSNTTAADQTTSAITFYNDGFGDYASSGGNAAWSFRRASKFFDIATYTGDGTSGRVIPHALGIKPGIMFIKCLDAAFNWIVYHRSIGSGQTLALNLTNAAGASSSFPAEPTATGFTVSDDSGINGANRRFVAYLFAHDPDTTNGIVQCGSFTEASGGTTVTLGWQPQWILFKTSTLSDAWYILDTSRGWTGSGNKFLNPNSSGAESSTNTLGAPTATGFTFPVLDGAGTGWVYMAIRAPIT